MKCKNCKKCEECKGDGNECCEICRSCKKYQIIVNIVSQYIKTVNVTFNTQNE